jgi:hypothetical protein
LLKALVSVSVRGDLKIRGYTVGQSPNPPLWVALAALVVWLLSGDSGWVGQTARAVFYVALTVWAYEEAVRGVNGFRRGLGALALLLVVAAIASALG